MQKGRYLLNASRSLLNNEVVVIFKLQDKRITLCFWVTIF